MNDQSDHDERWLRDGLAAAVPEPPGHPARADEAASLARRRRRTTIAVAGAVAGVVVIAGIGAVVGNGPSPTPDAPTADSESVDQGTCPPVAQNPRSDDFFDEPDPDLPDEVPEGARWVRLCTGNGHRLDVPADALTVGVDRLTETVNDIPRPEEDYGCTAELGYGYRLVFGGYPDQPDFVVSGALYGCELVTIGSAQRPGAEDLLRTFGALLREEREGRPRPEWEPPPPSAFPCDERPTTPAVARPGDMKVAVLCVRVKGGYARAEVSRGDLETLRESLRTDIGHNAYPGCANSPEVRLVGLTRWDERVTLPSICSVGWFSVPEPWSTASWGASWQPGDKAAAILQELLAVASDGGARGDVGGCPGEKPADFAAVNDDEVDLPDDVPAGATSVRLCSDELFGVSPVDALTTQVDDLAGAVNGLPRREQGACTDEGPVGYRLVFGYPDGSSFVVAGMLSGCGYNVVGSGYRDEPLLPLDTFVRLLRSQRSSQLPPATSLVTPACGTNVDAAYDLAETDDIVAASVCVHDLAGDKTRRAPVQADDLTILVSDLTGAGSDRERSPCNLTPERYAVTIVAVTSWGDPIVMQQDCEDFVVQGGRRWTPSADAQAIIDRLVSEARPAR